MAFLFIDYSQLVDEFKDRISPENYEKFKELSASFSSFKVSGLITERVSGFRLFPPNDETIKLISAWRKHIDSTLRNDAPVIDPLTQLIIHKKRESNSLDSSIIKIKNSGMYGQHALVVLNGGLPTVEMQYLTIGGLQDPIDYSDFGKKNKAQFKTKPQDRIKKITTKQNKPINPLLQSLIDKK
jgi:hypothetical protein